MKYEEYESIAKDLNADNALDIVKSLLEKAKSDSLTDEALRVTMTEELEQTKQKYKDLQVDYIQHFIGAPGKEDGESMDDLQARAAEEQKAAMDAITANMNN